MTWLNTSVMGSAPDMGRAVQVMGWGQPRTWDAGFKQLRFEEPSASKGAA